MNVIGGLQSCSLNSIKLNVPLPAAEDYSNKLKYGKTETLTRNNLFMAPKTEKRKLHCWCADLGCWCIRLCFFLPPQIHYFLHTLLSTRILVYQAQRGWLWILGYKPKTQYTTSTNSRLEGPNPLTHWQLWRMHKIC